MEHASSDQRNEMSEKPYTYAVGKEDHRLWFKQNFGIDGDAGSGAYFSECRRYRYVLWRVWDKAKPLMLWIGLNPSTADETKDDPTIRRCIAFARSLGSGGIIMANLFALRSTDPKVLRGHLDPIGPDNDLALKTAYHGCQPSVAAWGVHGAYGNRDLHVCDMLTKENTERFLSCLGCTKHGHPRHPLYVRGDTELIKFKARPRGHIGR
jgi:hypothetical protein